MIEVATQDGIDLDTWYEDFNRFAGDLYPGRYTRDYVKDKTIK